MSAALDPPLVRMPELGAGEWLNTPGPLTKQSLRGSVTLIDFWDYTCVNCLRTLPYLKAWHERYRDLGLTIIGVHAPEFRFARERPIVATAVQELNVPYPVLLDNDYVTWTRFANRAWPTKHLIDQDGYIRLRRQGEGHYQEVERAIQQLLRERAPESTLPDPLPALRAEDAPGAACYRGTPELHAGYRGGGLFGSALGNPEGFVTDGVMLYALPDAAERAEGHFYLQGFWQAWPENVALAGETEGRIIVPYRAAGINAVLSPSPDPVDLLLGLRPSSQEPVVEIRVNGRSLTPANAGADILFTADGRSYLQVDGPRMYAIQRSAHFSAGELELIFRARGLALYSLTFETCVAGSGNSDEEIFQRP